MGSEIEELKETIENFVIKHNVKKFEVYINREVTIPTQVEIEIRV